MGITSVGPNPNVSFAKTLEAQRDIRCIAQRARLLVAFEKGYSSRAQLLVPNDQLLGFQVQAYAIRVDTPGGHNAVGSDVSEVARHGALVVLGGRQLEMGDSACAAVVAHERICQVDISASVAVSLEQWVCDRALVAIGIDGRLEPLKEREFAHGEVHLE